jgi:chaperone required for assembly of F1-ATPase
MKRFYKAAAAAPVAGGIALYLDERPVKTPSRAPLVVPTEELADGIAAEWNGQGEKIDPRTMPLTGLANAAIDRVAPDPAAFARNLAAYGESDLLCYRAEGPKSLTTRQTERWDPLLEWARERFGVDFKTVCGVMHKAQPPRTVARLAAAVAARDPFRLAGLSPLVTVSGSLVIALALAEGAIGLEEGWQAANLDEAWQAEQWGEDPLAEQALLARRQDFDAGYLFLTLL